MSHNEKRGNALTSPEVEALTSKLAAPFDAGEVKFKPAVVSGSRAMALAYVDARVIQDRLDEVLGVAGWQDEYECLPDGSVVCRLRLRLGEEWITKMDVGGQSEQPDEGDRRKAAFSDALKRAAVKFGIGRYLYRLPTMWVDYDPQKRQFVRPPTLPASAIGHRPSAVGQKKPAATPRANGKHEEPKAESRKPKAESRKPSLPVSGEELHRRLNAYDTRLSAQGLCKPGDLVKHIVQAGVKAGYDADLANWTGAAIELSVEETKAFESRCREQRKGRKEVA